MSNDNRIVFVISSLKVGGAEKHTVKVINYLSQKGYDVGLVSMQNDSFFLKAVNDRSKVIFLDRKNFLDFQAMNKFISFYLQKGRGLIVAIDRGPMLFVFLASIVFRVKIKIVLSLRITILRGLIDRMKNVVFKAIARRIYGVIFVCETQRKFWFERYKLKVKSSEVIHNSVDISNYDATLYDSNLVREKLGFGRSDIVLGVNARLRPEKRHEDVLEVARSLINDGYSIRLLFIGGGDRETFLLDKAKEFGILDSLVITGLVENVAEYISAIDISVLCSDKVETFSNAVLECMAMGKPVVMTDIGGAREQVQDGFNGYLVSPKSPEEIYKRIKNIIDHDSVKSFGQNSREYVAGHFSDEKILRKHEDYYVKAIKKDKGKFGENMGTVNLFI